ncbi:hypothetical protein LJB42_002837 [Komagataella kurtzmanii]|nr:hypothetical protein LJB42_002837 [Komagataella kurtzmanii]
MKQEPGDSSDKSAPSGSITPQPKPPQQANVSNQQPQKPQQFSAADLNRIVLEYLNKKGYHKTESMLRMESSHIPAPPTNIPTPQTTNISRPTAPGRAPEYSDDPATIKRGYSILKSWCESSLDFYRPELEKFLYPVFVHCYLDLIARGYPSHAREFYDKFSKDHSVLHEYEISKLGGISLKEHLQENDVAKIFRSHKFKVLIGRTTFNLLLYFLNENDAVGGGVVLRLINQYIEPVITTEAIAVEREGELNLSEGIVELHTLNNTSIGGEQREISSVDAFNKKPVKLGKLQVDPEYSKELEAELKLKDEQEQAAQKKVSTTLLEEYRENFKVDPNDENNPSKDTLPLPLKSAQDLRNDIAMIQDSRAKIKLSAAQASLPSVCMYTFHNTNNDLTCLKFNDDSTMVASGFQDSFIKLWSIDGSPLRSLLKNDPYNQQNNDGVAVKGSRRLVGHSGAVYGVDFSPDNRYLISCSEDKTVRLWSLDTYTCLVSYKGHSSSVWDVKFSPMGHYFATASHDQTARLWSCDHIYPLRIFAGHLNDVDCVEFHPNSTYLFTGSSDKTARMWDIARGECVRVFMGHSGAINCLAVSPDGRWLASAGEDSVVCLWDISTGRRIKAMRGHGRSSIYSLAFSREGTVLVSTGADNSVRVWDVKKNTNSPSAQPEPINDVTAQGIQKKTEDLRRRKEIVATNDHMSVYFTKKTPVYTVHFTRRNLCLAGGVFGG